jgi:hypothetical protein
MLSIPPATITPLCPSWMLWLASMIDFMPLAQTLLMVVASVESGMLRGSAGRNTSIRHISGDERGCAVLSV